MLVEEGGHYTKSDAVLRIAMRLGLPLPVVAAALMPLPHFIRDTFYDQVGLVVQLLIKSQPVGFGLDRPARAATTGA